MKTLLNNSKALSQTGTFSISTEVYTEVQTHVLLFEYFSTFHAGEGVPT